MGVIFFLSHQGAASSDQQSGLFVTLLTPVANGMDIDLLTTIVRKSAHFSAYLILGILSFWTFTPIFRSGKAVGAMSICAAALFAASDEFHQSFIPGRSAEVRDVLIDTIGAAVGVGIIWLILHLKKRHTILKTTTTQK